MTFAEIKTEVFRRLNESASAPVFWSDDDVSEAILDGYAEISDATEWYERWSVITILAEQPYYDLRTVLPYGVLSVGAAFNEDTNRWLIPTRPAELDAGDSRWERRVGMPDRLMLRSPWFLGYWPISAAAGTTIKQFYTCLPLAPSSYPVADLWATVVESEPGFYPELHYGLVEYALSDLWAQDAETTLATQAWSAYLQHEEALKAMVDGRARVPLVHGYGDHAR